MIVVFEDGSSIETAGLSSLFSVKYVKFSNGRIEWWKNQRYHREDGPAVEYPDGYKEWWLNNEIYTFETWCDILNKTIEERVLLKLKYF